MRKSTWCASAALACMGLASGTAQAQLGTFGAGTSIPQLTYRQLMDCLYNQAQGSPGKPGRTNLAPSCPGFNSSGFGGLILFAPTTSNNGKLVLRTNDRANIGAPVSASVAYTDSTFGIANTADYDGVQFAFVDAVVNAADIAAWNSAGNPSKFGSIIQIPAFVSAVGIGFNGKDGTGVVSTSSRQHRLVAPAASTCRGRHCAGSCQAISPGGTTLS